MPFSLYTSGGRRARTIAATCPTCCRSQPLTVSRTLRSTLMLIPPLSYTIAHQGLRATSLWILFGVFIALKHSEQARASAAPAP